MLDKFKAWYAKPFDTGQSVTGWALFLLMIMVVSIFWKLILSHVIAAASD